MSDKLHNLDFVNSMAGGNQDFINQLLTLFVDSVPESIALINKHYENNDLENLAKEAHKLKSTINTVQIPSFIEKIKEIEMIGKTGQDLDKLPTLIAEFNDIMPRAVEQVKELL